MKKLISVLAVLAFVSPTVFAKGIFIPPGTKGAAMAGSIFAMTDGLTSVYWNPAGLTKLDKSGVELSSFFVSNSVKSNTPLSNAEFPIARIYSTSNGLPVTTEPASYTSKEFETSAVIPFVGGYHKYNDITFAVSYYGVAGGGGKWKNTAKDIVTGTDDIVASLEAQQGFAVMNISAAKELATNLCVGVGIDLINMSDKTTVKRDYTKNTGSAFTGSAVTSYAMGIEKTATGTGIQLVAGAMYKVQENLRTGLVIRTGSTVSLTGKGTYTRAGLAPLGMADLTYSTDYDQKYAYPMVVGIGAAYDATSKLTIALGIDMTDYSTMKTDVTYKTPLAGVFSNTNTSSKWISVTQIHIGADYRVDDKLSLQAGVQNDPVPYTRDALTLLSTNQYNMNYITLGGAYILGKVKLNASYAMGISDKPEKNGVEYEYPLSLYRISASMMF